MEHPLERVAGAPEHPGGRDVCAPGGGDRPDQRRTSLSPGSTGMVGIAERRYPPADRLVAANCRGVVPVALTSLAFAALHIRGAARREDVSATVVLLSVQAVASLATVVVALCWLKFAVGATSRGLGHRAGQAAFRRAAGTAALPAIIVPVYAINDLLLAARRWLHGGVVVDPIPLLLLAAALGILYYRTHRVVPCIVLHMAFNAVAVVARWSP